MRSSISSFNTAGFDTPASERAPRWRWTLVWVLALAIAAAIVGVDEIHWRSLGFRPNIRDSAQLWSIQRDRVYATKKIPLVILGASRIEFGVDMKLLAQLLPRYRSVMLAQNAHYPLAELRDLANDDRFHGVVLCDVESRGLYKLFTESQQPLVDYYHRQWSPSWHVHRLLLNGWQAHFDIANPDLGAIAGVRRWIDNVPPPQPEYFRFFTNRSGNIDYTKTNPEAAKRHFAELVADNKDLHALVSPDTWLAELDDVYKWTARINARGGRVIFYQSPTGGTVSRVDAVLHPRAQYWDRFAATVPAATLDAADDATLSAFPLPDDSHLDFRDKPAYTRALVDALTARGMLKR
jgi:hypothetical protein